MIQKAERVKDLVGAANNQAFLSDAAAIVFAVGDPEICSRCEKDTMIALEHMALAAVALRYGTCWIGAFDEGAVKHLLRIPMNMRIVALLPIGVPNETAVPKPRKKLSEIVFIEEWQAA